MWPPTPTRAPSAITRATSATTSSAPSATWAAWWASTSTRPLSPSDTKATGEPTFDELATHVEHFLDLGGEDTLALGSDWDGSDVPSWLATCDTAGELRRRFAERFGAQLTSKIFYTNARDFFVRNETD